MLLNNLDREVAEHPEELVVYGGSGKAARNARVPARDRPRAARRSATTRRCSCSRGKPVGVFRTHAEAPRVLIANAMLVPRWATWDEFRRLEALGLTMFGQMTAGSLDLHRHAGDPAGHVPDLRGGGARSTSARRPRRADDPDRGPRRDGRGAAARGDAWPARRSCASRSTRTGSSGGSRRGTSTRRPIRSTTRSRVSERPRGEAGALGRPARKRRRRRSRAGAPRRALRPRHRPDRGARPADRLRPAGPRRRGRGRAARVRPRRVPAPRRRVDRRATSRGCSSTCGPEATFSTTATTCAVRRSAAGVTDAFDYPGFVPAYIRPLFCRGQRAVPLGGALGRPGRHRGDRRGAARPVPGRRDPPALARARARAGGVPGVARADLLARLRRARAGRPGDQRARPLGPGPRPS